MKINLKTLRENGWFVRIDEQERELELQPPAMVSPEYMQLVGLVKKHCSTTLGVELVTGEFLQALQKAMILEVIE